MEKKLKSTIAGIFRMYGADKASDAKFRKDRILSLCMNDIKSNPELEKELDTSKKIKYFVIQTILYDIPSMPPFPCTAK